MTRKPKHQQHMSVMCRAYFLIRYTFLIERGLYVSDLNSPRDVIIIYNCLLYSLLVYTVYMHIGPNRFDPVNVHDFE